jgi:hypothetical protein
MENKNSNWEELDTWAVGGDNRLFSLYSTLSDWRKTETVSISAVATHSGNLDYVPDNILSPDICRAALTAKDADLDILSKIPYPEVQKEAIKMFLDEGNKPFVIYSFAGISDVQMAQDAVKGDAYCLQFVPDKLMTTELCKTALQSPNADKKVLEFIPERFRTPEIRKIAEDKFGEKPEQKEDRQKEMSLPLKRKSLSI